MIGTTAIVLLIKLRLVYSPGFEMMDSGTIAVATDMDDVDYSPDTGSGNESAPGSDQMDEQQSPEDSTGPGSVKAENAGQDLGDTSQSLPMPVQKRRRVTRACDECRRKKIKCDGKQPCTHCSVYSYGEMPLLLQVRDTVELIIAYHQSVRTTNLLTGGATLLLNT